MYEKYCSKERINEFNKRNVLIWISEIEKFIECSDKRNLFFRDIVNINCLVWYVVSEVIIIII